MTDAERKYMQARERVQRTMLNPIKELLEAQAHVYFDHAKRAEHAEEALERMRPHWAKGYTSDSEAAQASTNALSELWELLDAKDQTTAMERLRALVGKSSQIND